MSVLEPGIHSLLQPLIEEFVESGYNSSPTFKLWYEYLTCVSTPFKLFVATTKKPQLRSTSVLQAAVDPTLVCNQHN